MKVTILTIGFAIILAVLAELMFSYLGNLLGGPEWRWLVLLIAGLIGLAMIVWRLMPRKDKNEPIQVIIVDKNGTKVVVVKQSRWERFKEWWRNN